MISNTLLLVVFSLLDGMIAHIFPFNPAYTGMSFVPCLTFMCLVCIARSSRMNQALALAFCLGFFQDIYINNTLGLYTSCYMSVIFIATLWSNSISSSMFESILFVITTVFAKEILLYLILTLSNVTQIDMLTWFLKREFLTLLVNGVFSIFVLFIYHRMQSFLLGQDEQRRKGEKVKWLQLRLKEEKKGYK